MTAGPKALPGKRILSLGRLGFEIRLGIAVTLVFTLLVLSGCGAMGQGNSTSSKPIIDKEMETFLQAHQETGDFMGSVLVARGDDVLHSNGYGMADLEHSAPNTSETIFRLASLTKQFTAAAILQLQEQGKLNVNDPVDRYLPDYPHGKEITIDQLLNHTAGIPDYEFLQPSMVFRNAVSLDELIAKFSGLPLDFRPGSRFSYSNSGYVVLTAILENVSGQTYAEYLTDHIFQPVGMEQTHYDNADIVMQGRAAGYTLDGAGYQNAEFFDMSNVAGAGGLVSTVHDMYRWDRALYTDAVLDETSRHSYFAPTVELGEGGQYTYGGALLEIAGRDYILFSGQISGFFTTSLRYPDEEIFVIVLSNVSDPVAQAIALGLAAISLGDPYEVPGQDIAIEVDPAIYERYVGQYAIAPDTVVTILTEEGHLFAQVPDQPRFEIFPSSETEYFAKVGNTRIQLQFQIGADGMATGMTVKQDGQEIQAEKISEGVSK